MGRVTSAFTFLVAGDFLFETHRDRALYLGASVWKRSHWLKENVGRWRRIQDVQQAAAPLGPPVEREIDVRAVLGDDEDNAGHDGGQSRRKSGAKVAVK